MSDNKQIFISHSSENKEIVEKLCDYMVAIGINKDQLFCSSITGLDVKNGEKLNDRIEESLRNSKLLIFVLSVDFLNSSYCMEELGVGWFLAENNKAKCYYLVLPDIFDYSEINGFINKKIIKLTPLCEEKEVSRIVDDICVDMELQKPDDSIVTNAVDKFFKDTEPLFKAIIDYRKQREDEEKRREEELNTLRDNNKQLNKTSNILLQQIDYERKQHKIELLAKEYHTIEEDFNHFGGQTGLTIEKYNAEGEHFWSQMASRYLNIRKQLKSYGYPRLYHENIEILIATIYSAHGDLDVSYELIKSFFLHVRSSIYPRVFNNIVFDDSNDTHELIEIIQDKIANTDIGLKQDSYKKCLKFLLERNERLSEGVPKT